jgi:hypothetical protein
VTRPGAEALGQLSLIVFNNIVAFKKLSFIFNNIVALMCSLLFLNDLVKLLEWKFTRQGLTQLMKTVDCFV